MPGDLRRPADRARCGRSSHCPRCPTQPAIAVCAPMRQLWPTWIWLSSLTSSSITVSSIAPRSIVVLAPISQSAPITTRPTCGILSHFPRVLAPCRSRRRRSPRRLCTIVRAPTSAARVQRHARIQPHILADGRRRRRSTHAHRWPRARRCVALRADDRERPDARRGIDRGVARDARRRIDAGGGASGWVQNRRDARVRRIRVGVHELGQRRGVARPRARRSRPPRASRRAADGTWRWPERRWRRARRSPACRRDAR